MARLIQCDVCNTLVEPGRAHRLVLTSVCTCHKDYADPHSMAGIDICQACAQKIVVNGFNFMKEVQVND